MQCVIQKPSCLSLISCRRLTGEAFTRGEELPSLRRPPEGRSTINCAAYLVTPADVTVQIRRVSQAAGGVRYAADQLVNTDTQGVVSGEVHGGGKRCLSRFEANSRARRTFAFLTKNRRKDLHDGFCTKARSR
jgi:hypothetical protein